MICHECLMAGTHQIATALCRFCFVALCKEHLIELFREPPTFPQYACRHAPASPIEPASGRRATAHTAPAPSRPVEPARPAVHVGRLLPGLGNA
jgi:hypothetical protein